MARLPNAWFGVSVENREDGLPRIETLRATPARVRFLSIEPLLEELGEIDLSGIHWVIVGGESGPGARPMKEEWVLSILKQCRQYDVPFFSSSGEVHERTRRVVNFGDRPTMSNQERRRCRRCETRHRGNRSAHGACMDEDLLQVRAIGRLIKLTIQGNHYDYRYCTH